jgi:23S rRNA G2445 N2-methylase RlmL
LSELLSYHPHLIFFIRKNQGRILLKINKEELYKHGFKTAVNYGPIRESIAASVLHKSKLLDAKNHNGLAKIWDPMCGSGTLPLVASTIMDNAPVRSTN